MQTIRQDKHYKRLLTIAGSDSGGGAGIQADLKTFAALGCYGMSAITALTAQNTQGVYGIHPVPTDFVANQIDVIFNDIGADAVKIGMLFSSELIQVVAQQLKKHNAPNIVLDPVMVAQSGDKLLQDDAIEAIKTHLLPLAHVITPNVPEAALLSGLNIGNENDIQTVAHKLSQYGQSDILIKGGHFSGDDSTDWLYLKVENQMIPFNADRIKTHNNHGTGCTLSSAIAAYLAHGLHIEAAVQQAKTYISEAIRSGANYQLGHGHGPVQHFHQFWQ